MVIYPILMAGGAGTRFWPASRANFPKQFLKIISSRTMVEETLRRLSPIAPEENTIIVGNKDHHNLFHNLLGEKRYVILEEPLGRNTAPCIGFAAVYLKKQGVLDEPMAVLPADHFIADEDKFRETLLMGCGLAKQGDIITIGIVPTRPETGYGYLQKGAIKKQVDGVNVYEIKQFVEKPDQPTALQYLQSGEYFWNGGIFIFTPRVILEEIETHLPQVYEGLLKIEAEMDGQDYSEALSSVYLDFPSISIDYGIMEKTTRSRLALPGDFGWSDVGSWESLYELREKEKDEKGNLLQGETKIFDTESSFLFNQSEAMLVGLGLKEVLIVNTEDVVLVVDLKRSQEIKRIIDELRIRGPHSLL